MMLSVLEVHHWSGAGNRFVIIDGRGATTSRQQWSYLTPALCNRASIDLPQAEGVMVLCEVTTEVITADFYNPDGSFGSMCGNGGRAIVLFAQSVVDHPFSHEMLLVFSDMPYKANVVSPHQVTITFPAPLLVKEHPAGTLAAVDVDVTEVNVGNDHAVVEADPATFNPYPLRHHAAFPRGVNVSMLRTDTAGRWHIATFERGVEHITQACGTGAVAAAITLWLRKKAGRVLTVLPPSNSALHIELLGPGSDITSIRLTGDARVDHHPTFFDTKLLAYKP
jgi:diaminopimelate epimerase